MRIDPASGALPDNTVGTAFGRVPVSNVPSLGLPALLLLIALVLIVAVGTARRRTGT